MLRVQAERGESLASVSLSGDDGGVIAECVQADADALGDRPGLVRSHDGELATVVVDQVITVVRLRDAPERRANRARP